MNILDTDKIDMGDLAKQILQAIYRSNAIRALSEKIEDALKNATIEELSRLSEDKYERFYRVTASIGNKSDALRAGQGTTIYEAMTACARELNLYYYGPDSENVAGITERVAATKGAN